VIVANHLSDPRWNVRPGEADFGIIGAQDFNGSEGLTSFSAIGVPHSEDAN
jgi:hypothetical protein